MASRYRTNVAGDWDATAGTKWSTTSGGAGGASVPAAGDHVFFESGSADLKIGAGYSAQCANFNTAGWTGTARGSGGGLQSLSIAGSINIPSGSNWDTFYDNIVVTVAGGSPTQTVSIIPTMRGHLEFSVSAGAELLLLSDLSVVSLNESPTPTCKLIFGNSGTLNCGDFDITADWLFVFCERIIVGTSIWSIPGTSTAPQSVLQVYASTRTTFVDWTIDVTPNETFGGVTGSPQSSGGFTSELYAVDGSPSQAKDFDKLILRAGNHRLIPQASPSFNSIQLLPGSSVTIPSPRTLRSSAWNLNGTSVAPISLQNTAWPSGDCQLVSIDGTPIYCNNIRVGRGISASPAGLFHAGCQSRLDQPSGWAADSALGAMILPP